MTSPTPYAEVIGDPIAHSKSPLIHEFWLKKLGIEGEYRRCRVEAGGLGEYLSQRRADPAWRGCSITMPHKRAALAFAEGVNLGGHVLPLNLLTPCGNELHGSNTDLLGIVEAVGGGVRAEEGIIVVGSGAAAETAVMALSDFSHRITLVAREVAKARAELGELTRIVSIQSWEAPWPEASLLINASPLGMEGYPPFPFELTSLRAGGMVFDMVYAPLATDLLKRAEARGLRAVDGLRMLVGQARHQFLAFFGTIPPADLDGELRELLTA